MSRKLVTLIKDNPRLPGKHKRVLEAYAAFANNDGTNIYPSKDKVAKKASISRSAVYHNTEDLLRVRILVPAASHTCKVEACNKGATHYWGQQGKYTTVYNINLPVLENDQTYLLLNQPKVHVPKQLNLFVQNQLKVSVQKQLKDGVLKLDATQALKETPASLGKTLDSAPLGKELNSSASHEAGIDLLTDQYCVLSENDEDNTSTPPDPWAEEVTVRIPDDLGVSSSQANQEQSKPNGKGNPKYSQTWEMPLSGDIFTYAKLWARMKGCWSAFKNTQPSDPEIDLFAEIMAKCDENTCYPDDVMDWAKTHITQPKLLGGLRSVKGLHNAVCGDVSTTNGLLAQFKDHTDPRECPICLKKVQGINCKMCKSWVALNADGTPNEYCPGCIKKIPAYRRESGMGSYLMKSDI